MKRDLAETARRIVLYIATGALVVGCTSGCDLFSPRVIDGTPVPEQQSTVLPDGQEPPLPRASQQVEPGLAPVPGRQHLPEAYRSVRLVDPCALHSPSDAGRLFDLVPDAIVPGPTLNQCQLHLTNAEQDGPTWTLTATAGTTFGDQERGRGQRQELGGVGFWFMPPSPTDNATCAYIRDQGGGLGLGLRATKHIDTDRRDPCLVARDYALAVSKWWVNPALRSDKVTAPQLSVSAVDACAAAERIVADLDKPVRAAMPDPHSCALEEQGSNDRVLLLAYGLVAEPLAALGGPGAGHQAIEVDGNPGVLSKGTWPHVPHAGPNDCSVTLVAHEEPAIRPDQTRSDSDRFLQVVWAVSTDCDLARRGVDVGLAATR